MQLSSINSPKFTENGWSRWKDKGSSGSFKSASSTCRALAVDCCRYCRSNCRLLSSVCQLLSKLCQPYKLTVNSTVNLARGVRPVDHCRPTVDQMSYCRPVEAAVVWAVAGVDRNTIVCQELTGPPRRLETSVMGSHVVLLWQNCILCSVIEWTVCLSSYCRTVNHLVDTGWQYVHASPVNHLSISVNRLSTTVEWLSTYCRKLSTYCQLHLSNCQTGAQVLYSTGRYD